jgi:hypothetical protein
LLSNTDFLTELLLEELLKQKKRLWEQQTKALKISNIHK